MNTIGVMVAIIKDGQILLTKREDFEVWCLPGGMVESGEPLTHAALREVFEETGLTIQLEKMVRINTRTRPGGGQYIVTFRAAPTSDQLRPDPREVVDIKYFDFDALPEAIFLDDRSAIMDAINGVGGSAVVTTQIDWPFPASMQREDIYKMRDESGLSRQDFYQQNFCAEKIITKKEIG